MKLLTQVLSGVPEFAQLLAAMEGGRCPAALSGLSAVHRAHFAGAIRGLTQRTVVMVCADESESERMAKDLSFLTETPVPVLSARSFTFHNAATVSRQWEHRRLATLRAMMEGEIPVLVCTVESLMQRTLPPKALEQACVELEGGRCYDLSQLSETLISAGYTRCDQVEGVGQFALRGGIPDREQPFGIEKVFINGRMVYSGGGLDEEALKTTGRAIPVV